jgi:hypothetical protein
MAREPHGRFYIGQSTDAFRSRVIRFVGRFDF